MISSHLSAVRAVQEKKSRKKDILVHDPAYNEDVGVIGRIWTQKVFSLRDGLVVQQKCNALFCKARGAGSIGTRRASRSKVTHRWYSESVFSVTPLEALATDARQVAAYGPGGGSIPSIASCKSSVVRGGSVSCSPSRSSLMSSSRGFSLGWLAKTARIWPENSF
jgi:hypothetical protein